VDRNAPNRAALAPARAPPATGHGRCAREEPPPPPATRAPPVPVRSPRRPPRRRMRAGSAPTIPRNRGHARISAASGLALTCEHGTERTHRRPPAAVQLLQRLALRPGSNAPLHREVGRSETCPRATRRELANCVFHGRPRSGWGCGTRTAGRRSAYAACCGR